MASLTEFHTVYVSGVWQPQSKRPKIERSVFVFQTKSATDVLQPFLLSWRGTDGPRRCYTVCVCVCVSAAVQEKYIYKLQNVEWKPIICSQRVGERQQRRRKQRKTKLEKD